MEKESELQNLIKFLQTVGKLKQVKRQGWIDRGVKEPESVADHSFMLALMAMIEAEKQKLDVCKAVKFALVHDLPEALCGDIASRVKEEEQEVSNKEKHEMEEKALKEILGDLDKELSEEIFSLWQEFGEKKGREARLVYELDRLEAIIQAVEYEKEGNFKVSLQEFYDYAEPRVKNKRLKAVFEMLMKERRGSKAQGASFL